MLLALRLIHGHGLVHLDIKPENIFIKDDKFKLGDFDLANKTSMDGEVDEGDCRYMCRDLLLGGRADLTKVSHLRLNFVDLRKSLHALGCFASLFSPQL